MASRTRQPVPPAVAPPAISSGAPGPALAPSNADLASQLPDADCGYTVQPGDTLWGIAARNGGQGSAWPDLYSRNQGVVGDNPDLIFPGQQLNLCDGPTQDSPTQDSPSATTGPALIDMSEGGQCVDITEPTLIRSRMGDVTVYPDDYEGELPAGAVRASHHEQMLDLYERVEDGGSQLSVDVSNFTAGIDPVTDPEGYAAAVEKANAFQQRTMTSLGDLMKTDVGLQFLQELDTNEHTVSIQSGDSNETGPADPTKYGDRGNGVGTDSVITMNYDLGTYQQPGQEAEGWMDGRQQFGLYHELAHALHNGNGDRASGQTQVHQADDPSTTRMLNNSELQAMGFGDYSEGTYTDNVFREALGKERRPDYGGWVP